MKKDLTFPCSNHYEECISEVSSEWIVPYLRIGDLVWTEIDDQFHFDRAIEYNFSQNKTTGNLK